MSAVVQPVGRTPNRDTALARSGSDVAAAFARELAEAERMLTSAPALDSEPTADSGRAPPVSDGVGLQKGDADNVAEPRTVRVTRVVLQSEGEDSSAESDGSLEPGRLSNGDLALHQTSSAAVGTLDAHRNVVSDSGSDSDRLLAELADDDVYDDEGSNSEWDTLSDSAGEHDVSAQYQLEAENERLHDELADAKGHIQAYEQQLLAYDEDINNLLNTIAVLTAEKNKAVAAHAAAREQADQDRRASVENAKRAAQRHIEELEARHAGELQAATARVDELQAELVAARDKSSAGAPAATSAPSLDAGSAADMYREQLVIARVKLADACGACTLRRACVHLSSHHAHEQQAKTTCTSNACGTWRSN